MRVKRAQSCTLTKPIEVKNVTYLWCSDGWCYVPELKKRQIFYVDKDHLLIETSDWDGVIPLAEYTESIRMFIYSQSPLIWKEESEDFSEIYEEVSSNQRKNK